MMVLAPWERRMAYGEQVREEVRAREASLRNFFANVDVALRRGGPEAGPQKWGPDEAALQAALAAAQAEAHARLLDSIDTRGAMDALGDIVKAVNLYLAPRQEGKGALPGALLLRACAAYVTRILSAFGLAPAPGDAPGLGGGGEAEGGGAGGRAAAVLDAFCGFRDGVRRLARAGAPHRELLAACDGVRDGAMVDLGVRLEDAADGGSVWKADDPATLRAERAEKARAAAEARAKKLRARAEAARREADKFEKLAALPPPAAALADKYGAFDPGSGDPTHDAGGAPLEGKALEKGRKEAERLRRVRAPLEKKLAEEGPGFIEALRAEAEALEAQLEALQLGGGEASS
jgi:cysteinyl-tRNA synthetase